MNKKLLIFLCGASMSLSAMAIDMSQVRFHNEVQDTIVLNQILSNVYSQNLATSGDVLVAAGKSFLETPYVAHTLEGSPEVLTVNLDELDCTTFMETAVALALTVGERRNSWRDFVYNLERIRYRNGEMNGYPSRLHYFSDWAVDNMHKGFVKEATTLFPKNSYVIKTLDFMSSNADKYQALADSINLAGIKAMEMGYRGYRIPYLKSIDVANKNFAAEFKNGDIVAFVLKDKNLDTGHVGIVVMQGGVPYLMHASRAEGKVVISKNPLADYLKKNHNYLGVRVLRLED